MAHRLTLPSETEEAISMEGDEPQPLDSTRLAMSTEHREGGSRASLSQLRPQLCSRHCCCVGCCMLGAVVLIYIAIIALFVTTAIYGVILIKDCSMVQYFSFYGMLIVIGLFGTATVVLLSFWVVQHRYKWAWSPFTVGAFLFALTLIVISFGMNSLSEEEKQLTAVAQATSPLCVKWLQDIRILSKTWISLAAVAYFVSLSGAYFANL